MPVEVVKNSAAEPKGVTAVAKDASEASNLLLSNFLEVAPAESVIVRALLATGEARGTLRDVTVKAAASMIKAAIAASKAGELFAKLEACLEASKTGVLTAGLLEIAELLAGELDKAAVLRLLERAKELFGSEAAAVPGAATKALAAVLRAAVGGGVIAAADEPTALLKASLDGMEKAASAAESAAAACGIGAAAGALGEAALVSHGVMGRVEAAMDAKSKEAPHAREAAMLACAQLCATLGVKFEPYGIPMLARQVKAMSDKDKKVADASTRAARALLDGLSTLSVKAVLGALFEGMQVIGGGGRTKIECLQLAALLATKAPGTMGPCLPECIPLVMECLNDSNAKVEQAAVAALPVLCSCVENAEVASTLKEALMLALKKPDTTLACIDEVLMTTFCNPMDGTSLAFMMPILVRGIRDANYELVKKATVCTSNLCALVKESSDIAPFVPLLLPLLDKNTDHSIPDIRDASIVAKQKLLDGALHFGAIRRNSAHFGAIRRTSLTPRALPRQAPATCSTRCSASTRWRRWCATA